MNKVIELFELFRKVSDAAKARDSKLVKTSIDSFNKVYRRCNVAEQGAYHGMVHVYHRGNQ